MDTTGRSAHYLGWFWIDALGCENAGMAGFNLAKFPPLNCSCFDLFSIESWGQYSFCHGLFKKVCFRLNKDLDFQT